MKKSHNYLSQMRQRLGWFQDIINGFRIATCSRIIEIGHDNGSINEAETLCVSIIVTDVNNACPRMIVLRASALPADKTAAATLGCIMHIFAGIKDKYDLFLQLGFNPTPILGCSFIRPSERVYSRSKIHGGDGDLYGSWPILGHD